VGHECRTAGGQERSDPGIDSGRGGHRRNVAVRLRLPFRADTGDLDAEMSKYRNTGFTNGSGSRSTQNPAFRALRRINVNIPQAVDDLEDECTFTQESIG